MTIKQIYGFGKSVEMYNSVGLESRNMSFFAKCLYDVYKTAYLPGIISSYIEILTVDKTKLSNFVILVDDMLIQVLRRFDIS